MVVNNRNKNVVDPFNSSEQIKVKGFSQKNAAHFMHCHGKYFILFNNTMLANGKHSSNYNCIANTNKARFILIDGSFIMSEIEVVNKYEQLVLGTSQSTKDFISVLGNHKVREALCFSILQFYSILSRVHSGCLSCPQRGPTDKSNGFKLYTLNIVLTLILPRLNFL